MRVAWPAVIGAGVALVVGGAGLVRSSVPEASASSSGTSASSQTIVVSGAYVRAPVPPTRIAAAYFTVDNTGSQPDRLVSVVTGAGETSVLHAMTSSGSMEAMAGGIEIPAHGRLVLTTGGDHVMIENLLGQLKPGQQVSIDLQFARAGDIDVSAPVLSVFQPAPTAGGSP